MSRERASKTEILRVALVAVFFLAAPTAGDIGSCNQTATDLDAAKFFEAKQTLDCQRCIDCQLLTKACDTACGAPQTGEFPRACYPLVHDGEVCLDALRAASCTDYESFMADQDATVPTECDFCPPRAASGGGAQ